MSNLDLYPISAERQPVVSIHDGEAMADSRDVAAYFGKRHTEVLRAVRDLHCSDDFRRRNFASFKIKDLTGETTSHVLMTKNGFTFLVMGFTGSKAAGFKENYIARFDTMDAELRRQKEGAPDPLAVLNDPAAMRGLLLSYAERELALIGQVEELAPKAEALDRISTAQGSLCITDAAKALQVRPKALFAFLRARGWIYSRPGMSHERGYEAKVAAGLLEHKVVTIQRADASDLVIEQVRVTPKGLTRLAQILKDTATAAA
jgi:Rha family phage regulatory protein